MEYHRLTTENLYDAKLYANRYDMMRSLDQQGGVFVEVGVAFGDFSKFVLDNCRFEKSYLVDIFTLDQQEYLWGKHRGEIFGEYSHEAYVRDRFEKEVKAGNVEVVRSDSFEFLNDLPKDFADVIYIDGDHSYLGVLRDAQVAQKALKNSGYLVFNDYILYDHIAQTELGVVPVVNDLCKSGNWKITHFAFEKNMFCDVALRKF
ncbi:class I SAM-dependent methyltransferase [Rhizobium lusitanum]|jgi:hypothetical protein|uniref:class I SAM-dependent methyltransferase n=1 Tax=Rhizobium lusitanum TaxID=293958 RepID=UPI001573E302|nr:class I SAM-dependent methyltransferase [Rhizobium lusitanum]NTJ11457.1 class I SAM-dependent methyltransferase [Rhizobium lusitanum]